MKYICNSCGSEFLRWSGKCSSCGQWGTLEQLPEESDISQEVTTKAKADYRAITEYDSSTDSKKGVAGRLSTGFDEFDRVLGGGMVSGEVVLMSGEPGVGSLHFFCR